MKKIYSVLMALATAATVFTGCKESNDAFFTATEDDAPRILNTDIPETTGGERASLPSITRNNNFKFEVIVTPAQFTKVTWFIDGEQVFEGNTIDYTLMAGKYDVDIVATTTKNKSTKRLCTLEVLPADGDPVLDDTEKARWFQTGTTKTVAGQNLANLKVLYIGETKVDVVATANDITFAIPADLEMGTYKLVGETAEGEKFGLGNTWVTPDEWVEPGVETIVLWEGDQAVPEWTCEDWFSTKMQELVNEGKVGVGSPLTIEFSVPEDVDYTSIVLIGNDWRGILTGGTEDERGDIHPEAGQTSVTVELPQVGIDIIKTNGFYLTGHGYSIKKVTVQTVAEEPVNKTLYQGDFDMPDWAAQDLCNDKVKELVEAGTIKVGTKFVIEGAMTADDYCSVAVINESWESIITGKKDDERGDLNFGEETEVSFELGEAGLECIKTGGFFLAGHGYKVTKIYFE